MRVYSSFVPIAFLAPYMAFLAPYMALPPKCEYVVKVALKVCLLYSLLNPQLVIYALYKLLYVIFVAKSQMHWVKAVARPVSGGAAL